MDSRRSCVIPEPLSHDIGASRPGAREGHPSNNRRFGAGTSPTGAGTLTIDPGAIRRATVPLLVEEDAFAGAAGYLNTASIGIPPRVALEDLRAAVDAWGEGGADARAYDEYVERARAAFARLHGVGPETVAIGPQASYFIGIVAASLPPDAEVVAFGGDFTSVLFPLLARSDLRVRLVEDLDALPGALRPSTALVAVSAVQSADGRLAGLAELREAAARCGALTLIDATQACGWLPLAAGDYDFVTAAGYKWLLSPRGSAFMTVGPAALERLQPTAPGWFAGEPRWDALYGGPLRLAPDARRLDMSPAWLTWVGTARALEYLEEHGIDAIHAHNVALADRARAALGLEPGGSAVLSLSQGVDQQALSRRGLRVATRAGQVRACFHLYNSAADADALADAVLGR